MTKYILVGCHSGIEPHFSDLVSNLQLFHKEYPAKRIAEELSLKHYKDDSDYTNYPNITFALKDNDNFIKNLVCTIPSEFIWSSSNKRRGYDRPEEVNYVTNTSNMDEKVNGVRKGYSDKDAGTLNAYIRYYYDKENDIMYLYIVKNMGNHRFAMKAMANEGKSFDVLVKVQSHDFNEQLNQEDFIKIEADGHHSDADNRQSQNETQKFYSGYRSGHHQFVECFNFLLQQRLNYNGIMQQEYEAADNEYKKQFVHKDIDGKTVTYKDWPNLTSIMGLNKGISNGMFKKYTKENVCYALETIKEAAKITGETEINNTVIWSTASSFNSLCEKRGHTTTCKHLELKDYIIDLFRYSNENPMQDPLLLSSFTQKGGVKDVNYIAIEMYFKGRVFNTWMKRRRKKDRGYTASDPGFTHLIDGVDKLLRKQAAANCL